MLYSVVLVSAVQRSESLYVYLYPLFFGLPFHLGHHRVEFPELYSGCSFLLESISHSHSCPNAETGYKEIAEKVLKCSEGLPQPQLLLRGRCGTGSQQMLSNTSMKTQPTLSCICPTALTTQDRMMDDCLTRRQMLLGRCQVSEAL